LNTIQAPVILFETKFTTAWRHPHPGATDKPGYVTLSDAKGLELDTITQRRFLIILGTDSVCLAVKEEVARRTPTCRGAQIGTWLRRTTGFRLAAERRVSN